MEAPFAHPTWIAVGLAMVLIGAWLVRWASRNNMATAISGAAAEAAIKTLRKGAKVETPREIGSRIDDLRSAPGSTGKAKKVAGYAVRHAMSQLFGATGFIMIMAGLVTALLGVFYA